jgi:hypothetical protein
MTLMDDPDAQGNNAGNHYHNPSSIIKGITLRGK